MKNALITVVIILVIAGLLLIPTYNSLVTMEESVDAAWAQVENQLKRRADLIPNLMETVKGYAVHEKEVLTQITEARSGIQNAKSISEYEDANNELTEALNNFNVVVESYPELKADSNFREFQAELSGTENRISTERMRYNESVEEFNKKVKRFPTNMVASIFGFEAKEYFQISEGDAEVPKVDF